MSTRLSLCILFICAAFATNAQQADTTAAAFPGARYINTVAAKANAIEDKLDRKSEKALRQFKKQEDKLLQKLHSLDTNVAKQMAEQAKARYSELEEKLKKPGKLTQYIPGLDSASTALNFLNQNPQVKEVSDKLKAAIGKVDALKEQLQKAEDIKQFLRERKEQLRAQLEKFGLAKNLKKINKKIYYYQQQVAEYKNILNDPKKIEKKALELLSKTKLFKDFMRKNSMLASLFRMPGDPSDPAYTASLAGLQTRAQVNSLIQSQVAAGGSNAMQQFRQNLQNAQSQLSQLKDRVLKMGGGSSDAAMPEGFKPNNQKTKSFWQRLEYGTNLQSQKATNYFPVTTDLGLSVGYKLNDKSIIGIGASYKLGLGRGWNDIKFSSQGAGIRSFIDWKIKGSFWVSGGYERNFRPALTVGTGSPSLGGGWGEAGLIGIQKKLSIKTKFFKQTSIRLLWDFLSYQQIPRSQPVIFRIGYNF